MIEIKLEDFINEMGFRVTTSPGNEGIETMRDGVVVSRRPASREVVRLWRALVRACGQAHSNAQEVGKFIIDRGTATSAAERRADIQSQLADLAVANATALGKYPMGVRGNVLAGYYREDEKLGVAFASDSPRIEDRITEAEEANA